MERRTRLTAAEFRLNNVVFALNGVVLSSTHLADLLLLTEGYPGESGQSVLLTLMTNVVGELYEILLDEIRFLIFVFVFGRHNHFGPL